MINFSRTCLYDKYVFMLAGDMGSDIIVMKTKRFKVVFRQATKYLIPCNCMEFFYSNIENTCVKHRRKK